MQNTEQFAQTIAQSLLGAEADHPARPLIAMRGIRKSYYIGQPNELEILHGIDLTVYPGEFVAIVGESGSGKSTLMNIIGVLDKPTAGEYVLDGVNIHEADDNDLAAIRNRKIGFVFQTYNLPRQGLAGPGRHGRADAPPAQRAFRRAEAAGGDRPRHGQ